MTKVKLWGGASDGMTLELGDVVIRERRAIECMRPQPAYPVSVWDARVKPMVTPNWERDLYEHRLIGGKHDHPCMKGLVVECEWDAWINDLQDSPALARTIVRVQRPDRVKVLITRWCPWRP